MSQRGSVNFLALVSNAAIACGGYYVGFYIRFRGQIQPVNLKAFTASIPYIAALAMFLSWFFQLNLSSRRRLGETVYNIALAVIFLNVGSMSITYLNRQFAFPRSVFFLSAFVQCAGLVAWHLMTTSILRTRHKPKNTVVISSNGEGWRLANRLRLFRGDEYRIVNTYNTSSDFKVPEALENAEVVFVDFSVPPSIKREIVEYCLAEDKQAVIVPGVYDIVLQNAQVSTIDDLPVFEVEALSLTPVQQAVKRLGDVLLSIVLLIVTAPLFLVISLAIKLTSLGPVFYRQKRVGLNNREFEIIKFRTMVDGAENMTGPVLATEDDPRVTKIGRLLRPTRLDELPQLLNILKGDMSFVGPRPERPHFVDKFSSEIPGYAYRLKVRPGLTGLAQVLGKYTTDPESKLRFDLYYIRNYSIILDIQIMLQTLRVILTPEAARGMAEVREVAASSTSDTDGPE